MQQFIGIRFTRRGKRSKHLGYQSYNAIGDLHILSEWFTSYGFRVTHTCTAYYDRVVEVLEDSEEDDGPPADHAYYPLTAGVTLFDFVYQAVSQGGTAHNACLTNEDGLSCVVYPDSPTKSRLCPAHVREVSDGTYISGESIAYFAALLEGAVAR